MYEIYSIIKEYKKLKNRDNNREKNKTRKKFEK